MPGLMWRVVNVTGMLEHLLTHLPKDKYNFLPQTFTFHIRDTQCRWNENPLTLHLDRGDWQLEEGVTVKQTVKMDIRVLSMLIMGAVSPSEAWIRHWLKAPEALLPALEILFPHQEPCLQLIDYF